jgi:hypothetical protein
MDLIESDKIQYKIIFRALRTIGFILLGWSCIMLLLFLFFSMQNMYDGLEVNNLDVFNNTPSWFHSVFLEGVFGGPVMQWYQGIDILTRYRLGRKSGGMAFYVLMFFISIIILTIVSVKKKKALISTLSFFGFLIVFYILTSKFLMFNYPSFIKFADSNGYDMMSNKLITINFYYNRYEAGIGFGYFNVTKVANFLNKYVVGVINAVVPLISSLFTFIIGLIFLKRKPKRSATNLLGWAFLGWTILNLLFLVIETIFGVTPMLFFGLYYLALVFFLLVAIFSLVGVVLCWKK